MPKKSKNTGDKVIPFTLYGHPLGVPYDKPVELHEVSISSTPEGLRALAKHFLETADLMAEDDADADPEDNFGSHWHLQPIRTGTGQKFPELVICSLDKERIKGTKIVYLQNLNDEDDHGMFKRVTAK